MIHGCKQVHLPDEVVAICMLAFQLLKNEATLGANVMGFINTTEEA